MSYKELKIWQKGMEIVDDVYQLTASFPKEEVYGLTAQMRRCGVSIPSNIAEGSQRTSAKEFSNFILIAKGSLAELETQILISIRQKFAKEDRAKEILLKADELHRMLYSFYHSLLTQVSSPKSQVL